MCVQAILYLQLIKTNILQKNFKKSVPVQFDKVITIILKSYEICLQQLIYDMV